MNDNYKLSGVVNVFGIVPTFLLPIFEKENEYYFAINATVKEDKVEDSPNIISFEKLDKDTDPANDLISKIKKIKELDINNLDNNKEEFKLGGNFIYYYQNRSKKIISGDIYNISIYLKNYIETNNIDKYEYTKIKEFLEYADNIINKPKIKEKKLKK